MSRIRELYMEIDVAGRRFSCPDEVLTLKPQDAAEITDAWFARRKQPPPKKYTVQSGDTIGGIAEAHNTSVGVLQEANKLESTTIYPDQQLRIPPKEDAPTEVSYERLDKATVGQQVWLVVDYKGQVNSIRTVLVEKEELLSESGTISVIQNGSETRTIRLQEPQAEHMRGSRKVAKVQLRPKSDDDLDK